jgi:uncharacterized membrane protein
VRAGGRYLAPLAAGAATAAVVTKLVTPSQTRQERRASATQDARGSVNAALVGAMAALLSRRWRREAPSAAYVGLGLATVGLLSYSVYLGSRRAREGRAAADAAPASQLAQAPGVRHGRFAAAVRTAAGDMLRGLP